MAASSYQNYQSISLFAPDGTPAYLKNLESAAALGRTAVMGIGKECGIVLAWNGVGASTATSPQSDKKSQSPGKLQPTDLLIQNRKVFLTDSSIYTFSGITNDGLLLYDEIQQSRMYNQIYKNNEKVDLSSWQQDSAYRCIVNSRRPWGVVGLYLCFVDEIEGEKIKSLNDLDLENNKSRYSSDPESNPDSIKFITSEIKPKTRKLRGLELQPTGTVRCVRSSAIGTRGQSCKTVLTDCDVSEMAYDELLKVLIKAMKNAHGEGISEEEFMANIEGFVIDKDGVRGVEL